MDIYIKIQIIMTATQWKLLFHIFIIIVIFSGGFFTGRRTIETKKIIKTEYIKGDTIKDTIFSPIPVQVEKPIDTMNIIKKCIEDGIYQELWPNKVVTEYIKVTAEDTVKIVNDWATKRNYNELLFNSDTLGTCSVNIELQYNRLKFVNYNFEPITKKITDEKIKVKMFSPFVGLGYITNPWDEFDDPLLNLTLGAFVKEKYGLQINLMHMLESKKDYVGCTFLYKF
jgi:hypothetical protein